MSYQMPLEPHRPRLDSSNPFEQLASTWVDESKALRLDPNKPPPPEIVRRRLSEIQALWDKHAKVGDVAIGRHQRRANKSRIQTGQNT